MINKRKARETAGFMFHATFRRVIDSPFSSINEQKRIYVGTSIFDKSMQEKPYTRLRYEH